MTKCGQANCEKPATHRMFWPGSEPLPICEDCKPKAERIAGAMGFHLHFEDLKE
jgi:hypothetical protein